MVWFHFLALVLQLEATVIIVLFLMLLLLCDCCACGVFEAAGVLCFFTFGVVMCFLLSCCFSMFVVLLLTVLGFCKGRYHGLCPLASVFVPCFYAIFENKQENIEPFDDMS